MRELCAWIAGFFVVFTLLPILTMAEKSVPKPYGMGVEAVVILGITLLYLKLGIIAWLTRLVFRKIKKPNKAEMVTPQKPSD